MSRSRNPQLAWEQDAVIAQLVFQPFFRQLSEHQRRLVRTAVLLYQEERRQGVRYPDYSFVVFPMSKAYEGFLKEYLYSMRLLSQDEYLDNRFRIGRALNPDVSPKHRDENWFFDDLVRLCQPDTARQLWDTWLECRNRLFHYFPGKESELSLQTAGKKLLDITQAMQMALACQRESER